MRAGFLLKKLILWGVILVFLGVCGVCLYGRLYLKKWELNTEFHFLVSEEKSVEAGAEFIKLEGGAGYVLRYQDKDYVVLSVYLSQKDAESVQEVLSLQNRQTKLISISSKTLYFRGKKQWKKAGMYVGALRTFHACLSVLEESITRLEGGMTQEKNKGILKDLKNQLVYMSEVYASTYPTFSLLCSHLVTQLQNEGEKVVYASRMRYILCEAVSEYLNESKQFV